MTTPVAVVGNPRRGSRTASFARTLLDAITGETTKQVHKNLDEPGESITIDNFQAAIV